MAARADNQISATSTLSLLGLSNPKVHRQSCHALMVCTYLWL